MFSAQTNNLQCIYPVEMMFQTNFVCTWKQRDEASLQNSILWGCILCGYAGGILCHISYDVTPFSYICQCHFHGANWKPEIQIYRMHSILMLRISPFYTKSEFPFWVTGKGLPRLSRRRKPVDNSVLKVDRAWVGFLLGMHRIDCSADDTQLKGRMFQSDFRGSKWRLFGFWRFTHSMILLIHKRLTPTVLQ